MKIQPRYYPIILIATFMIFLLIGLLLGFRPEHGGEGNGRGALIMFASLVAGALP
jgi:hypothetical protein